MKTVTFQAPVPRKGSDDVSSVSVRKPLAGDLRGAKLTELLQMDVSAHLKVLPRIIEPGLAPDEIAGLEPVDLLALSSALVGFFMTPEAAAEAATIQ